MPLKIRYEVDLSFIHRYLDTVVFHGGHDGNLFVSGGLCVEKLDTIELKETFQSFAWGLVDLARTDPIQLNRSDRVPRAKHYPDLC
jgi:hypothetical protein